MTKSFRNGSKLGAGLAVAKKQRGVSMIVVFLVLAVAIFFITVAFKIGPSYMEYMTVAKIAEDVSNDTVLLKGSKSKVIKHIDQSYRTNNLWDLEAKNTIELQKDGSRGYLVTVNYEKRINLFSTLDVVTVFHKPLFDE